MTRGSADKQGESAARPVPHLPPPQDAPQTDMRVAFVFFALAGLVAPFLGELVVDERLGLHTEGAAEELAMASLVALVLLLVLALGFGTTAWPVLLAGALVADVCAFIGYGVLLLLVGLG